MPAENRPQVGVGAIITGPDGRVVIGRRKNPKPNAPGRGHWGFPGGHLEYGETMLQCAERETLEETGLRVRGASMAGVAESVFPEAGAHYITLFVRCELVDPEGQPETLEPDKCEGWTWKSWDEIRAMWKGDDEAQRLFLPIMNLLNSQPDFGKN